MLENSKQTNQNTSYNTFGIINKLRKQQEFEVDAKEKKNKFVSKYINEQTKWNSKIREKQNIIIDLKTIIKNLEIHNTTLIAIFAIAIAFSLVSLIILTPLSIIGLATKPHLMWGLGIISGLVGIGVGSASIKSSIALNKKKNELEKVSYEREHFRSLLSKRDVINTFLNYDKLIDLNIIAISRQEHMSLMQTDIWHHPQFISHLEDLDQAEQYEKNGLPIPQELQKRIQQKFVNYV